MWKWSRAQIPDFYGRNELNTLRMECRRPGTTCMYMTAWLFSSTTAGGRCSTLSNSSVQ
ncbi:hypothetical protein Bbelb_072960, partial [Branchiostoma belcheri]